MIIHRGVRYGALAAVGSASALVACLVWNAAMTTPAVAAETERAAVSPGKPQQPVSLRDRLIVGLRARLNTEIAFIDLVVMRVNSGRLPQRVVDQTFFWARSRASVVRAGRTRRPIIYFQPAMRARAARLRVEL
jgi:hypothetical protein